MHALITFSLVQRFVRFDPQTSLMSTNDYIDTLGYAQAHTDGMTSMVSVEGLDEFIYPASCSAARLDLGRLHEHSCSALQDSTPTGATEAG